MKSHIFDVQTADSTIFRGDIHVMTTNGRRVNHFVNEEIK